MKKKNGRLLERSLARELSREELEHVSGALAATFTDTPSGFPSSIDD